MDRAYYEAYDDRYRQVHGKNLKWFADVPTGIVSEVLEKYRVSGRILEIGCGEGRDAGHLLKRGADLLATDLSEEAISFCRAQWPEYAGVFRVLDCLKDGLEEEFSFLYAVAVLHMLVRDEDRMRFYRFVHRHLREDGIGLICSMGDGCTERSTDIAKAFDLQERIHEATGTHLALAGTSYRGVSFATFRKELAENGLRILEEGITIVEPDYGKMMYAVVQKA